MVMELILALALLQLNGFANQSVLVLLLVILLWLTTFFISVPCHSQLSEGKDDRVIERLIGTNWIRTFLWSFKGLVVCF